MAERIYIRAAGMACPVGLTWLSSCAAIRAGVTRKSFSPYRDDAGHEIVTSQLVEGLERRAPATERYLYLLSHALREIACSDGSAALEGPLLLSLPHASPKCEVLADGLSTQLSMRFDPRKIHVVTEGAYGGYLAIQHAREIAKSTRHCIVAGADSLISARTLAPLAGSQRLLVDGNADGFIPGEAAAAILLTRTGGHALAAVHGLGLGREPSTLDNDLPLRAEGLVAAVTAALREAGIRLEDIDFRLSDASGESFFFKEQALLLSRMLRERKRELPLWLCARSLGYTGAAAGLCGLLFGVAAFARGYAPGPLALACAGNDVGDRAALVVHR